MNVRIRLGLALAASLAAAVSAPANAGTGCNGVVNVLVWGCAPWDNNNGAKFPYYTKKQTTIPTSQGKVVVQNGQQMVLANGQYYPMISQDGGGLVASGGGNFRVWTQ